MCRIAAAVILLMPDGIPSGRSLCVLISSLWRATMYLVRIISLILGGTFPCARILKKVARVVGLTHGNPHLRLDLLYDVMSLMKMSSESSSLPGAFARLRLEMMSVIWCGDICIFFLFRIEPLVFLSRCDRFKFKEGG